MSNSIIVLFTAIIIIAVFIEWYFMNGDDE